MKNVIRFTKVNLPYGWMSNMSNHPVIFNEIEFPRAEHLFIWLRLKNRTKAQAEVICQMKNPIQIKRYSKRMLKSGQWTFENKMLSQRDLDIMKIVVWYKLVTNPELASELIDTGDLMIYEDVTSRTSAKNSSMFWGACCICEEEDKVESHWVGLNHLGKIWMKHRSFIKEFIKSTGVTDVESIVKHISSVIKNEAVRLGYIINQ